MVGSWIEAESLTLPRTAYDRSITCFKPVEILRLRTNIMDIDMVGSGERKKTKRQHTISIYRTNPYINRAMADNDNNDTIEINVD
ncbi:hypothetical protein QQP08_017358 [Theobroma cacao]|nr:hypothetical protein QQP08_017358 [Theobroma cacao]